MNKTLIIAKIKRQQAELQEIIESLQSENKGGPVIEILKKREEELAQLIEAIQDKSSIPQGDVSFQPEPVMNEITEKVKKVKEGVKRLRELKQEKKRILEALRQD